MNDKKNNCDIIFLIVYLHVFVYIFVHYFLFLTARGLVVRNMGRKRNPFNRIAKEIGRTTERVAKQVERTAKQATSLIEPKGILKTAAGAVLCCMGIPVPIAQTLAHGGVEKADHKSVKFKDMAKIAAVAAAGQAVGHMADTTTTSPLSQAVANGLGQAAIAGVTKQDPFKAFIAGVTQKATEQYCKSKHYTFAQTVATNFATNVATAAAAGDPRPLKHAVQSLCNELVQKAVTLAKEYDADQKRYEQQTEIWNKQEEACKKFTDAYNRYAKEGKTDEAVLQSLMEQRAIMDAIIATTSPLYRQLEAEMRAIHARIEPIQAQMQILSSILEQGSGSDHELYKQLHCPVQKNVEGVYLMPDRVTVCTHTEILRATTQKHNVLHAITARFFAPMRIRRECAQQPQPDVSKQAIRRPILPASYICLPIPADGSPLATPLTKQGQRTGQAENSDPDLDYDFSPLGQ